MRMTALKEKLGSSLYYMPRKYAYTRLFRNRHGYDMDWKNPQTLDEKMCWLIVHSYGRRESFFADKIKVRDYVKEKGYGALLTRVYGIWKAADDIDISVLPEKFVLKTNHAAGEEYYIICSNKDAIDWVVGLQRMKKAMHTNYANRYCEYHYKYIKRRIFAEEYLDDTREERMTDYKVHCFDGKPYCIEICSNRAESVKSDYYDLEWNDLGYVSDEMKSEKKHEKPQSLELILKAAKDLSEPFPYARIDFYDVDGKAYFGEITMCPSGGNNHELNEKGQIEMGKKLHLPSKREILKKKLFGYQGRNL